MADHCSRKLFPFPIIIFIWSRLCLAWWYRAGMWYPLAFFTATNVPAGWRLSEVGWYNYLQKCLFTLLRAFECGVPSMPRCLPPIYKFAISVLPVALSKSTHIYFYLLYIWEASRWQTGCIFYCCSVLLYILRLPDTIKTCAWNVALLQIGVAAYHSVC